MKCRVEICENEVVGARSQLCNGHYLRVQHAKKNKTEPDLTTAVGAHPRARNGSGRKKKAVVKVERLTLREVLAGTELWPGVPLPEPGTEEYETFPACGYFGCFCPPLAEVDRIVVSLEAM